MTTCLRIFLPAAALVLPFLGSAQTSPISQGKATQAIPSPRFYVGLAAATGSAASPDGFAGTPTTPTTRNSISVLPRFTAGWQVLPRLAVQLSAQYAQQNDTYNFVEGRVDANGQVHQLPGSYGFRFHSVIAPVLVRYTLINDLARRLQLDVLGGVTFVHRFTQYHNVVNIPAPDSTQAPITSVDYDRSSTGVHLSLGPSLRYRLGSQLEITADVVANYLVNNGTATVNGYVATTSTTRPSFTSSLGLRYRFGAR
ncbi:MAG: hypothetical protein EOO63_10505 [Hymenobacter sp.]|nr:MAG: hypothetical protein EOO63_10505 [Hymenobacter sp.]